MLLKSYVKVLKVLYDAIMKFFLDAHVVPFFNYLSGGSYMFEIVKIMYSRRKRNLLSWLHCNG